MADRGLVGTIGLSLLLALGAVPPSSASGAVEAGSRTPKADDPTTRTIVPGALPRGRDAEIDFMQDGVIHTADGTALPILTPVNGEQRQLLGDSRKGWLVAVRTGTLSRVIAVRPGRRSVVVRNTRATNYSDSSVGWRAARDGELLISTDFNRGGSYHKVQDLAGRRLGSDDTGGFFNPLDADAGHVVTYRANTFSRLRLIDWVPRTSRTEIAKSASYASLRDDLVFVRTSGRHSGPTSISAPGTPAWVQPFAPLAVSPDGETAIGHRVSRSAFDSPAILDVRRMSDGALLDSIAFGPPITEDNWSITADHEQSVGWESNRRFVFQLHSPSGAVLVRCRLDGDCQRASDYGGNITTPYETFMWW